MDRKAKRSRLCVAACKDDENGQLTAAPTMKRIPICLLLVVYEAERLKIHLRNLTKALIVNKTMLRKQIYILGPKELALETDKVVQAIYWF